MRSTYLPVSVTSLRELFEEVGALMLAQKMFGKPGKHDCNARSLERSEESRRGFVGVTTGTD